ncbi:hypothetical protein [Kitasatospora sp. NPDC050543]|uniref:hypothetical protein n=1 Tax=Kitasatospora sp. NPDC050543 TaxID=3364054 RepID=UPI00379B0830
MTDSVSPADGTGTAAPAASIVTGTSAIGDGTAPIGAPEAPEVLTAPTAPPGTADGTPEAPGSADGTDGTDRTDGTERADGTSDDTVAPAPESEEQRAERRARARRRWLAAARWSAAVLVLGLTGTAAAIGVTTPDRTDLPGLATKGDGRYTYPQLVLPPLPPLPSGRSTPGPQDARHTADLRLLLLPVPKEAGGSLTPLSFAVPTASGPASPSGSTSPSPSASASGSATPTPTATFSPSLSPSPSSSSVTSAPAASPSPSGAPGPAAWVRCEDVAAEQRDPATLLSSLAENACRSATVREWTAQDGTRTQIRLLGFGSSTEGREVFGLLRASGAPKDLDGLNTVSDKDYAGVPGVRLSLRANGEGGADSRATARVGYLHAGDVVGVIVMTNPGGVPAQAFRQAVTLQSDLLAGASGPS